jgi:hypothetical protein
MDKRSGYFIALLKLALDETQQDFGPWKLVPVSGISTQGRNIIQLSQGLDIDVLWTMTSKERESQLLPIRIPLLKGLMGYRLLIVRQQDAKRFAGINSLSQLEKLTAGQGHDWPDASILAANHIRVVTSASYNALFIMLHSGRFDFLPRGLTEPFAELTERPRLHLMVEPHLALFYPTAEYFFVNRHNTALANRLEVGLRRAIKDGRFNELFRHYPVNAKAFDQAHLQSRTVIHLQNPLLPDATPLAEKELWFYPGEEIEAESHSATEREANPAG